MKRTSVALCIAILLCAVEAFAQQSQSQPAATLTVPHLVKFGGVVNQVKGKTVGITFALYKEEQGGAALWLETQNVSLDANGRYSVLLGASKTEGVPMELFTSGDARWLGVQVENQKEQSRVLLVSVPYALKAADAETVGGKPPSAFMLAAPVAPTTNTPSSGVKASTMLPATTGTGTTNFVPLWTSSTNLGNSALFQTGGTGLIGRVGVGTQTPAAKLDVKGGAFIRGALNLPATAAATSTAGTSSNPLNLAASSFKSGTGGGAVNQTFRWQAEPVANNTPAPSGKLNLLFGAGASTPAETGLSISSKGTIAVKGVADGTSLLSVRSGAGAGVERFSVDGFGNITNSGVIVAGNDINTSGFLFSNGLDSAGPTTLHSGLAVEGETTVSTGGVVSMRVDAGGHFFFGPKEGNSNFRLFNVRGKNSQNLFVVDENGHVFTARPD